jgi:hypothetical protein
VLIDILGMHKHNKIETMQVGMHKQNQIEIMQNKMTMANKKLQEFYFIQH